MPPAPSGWRERPLWPGDREYFTRHRACVPLDISRLIGDFAEGWHARLAAWLAHAEIDSDEQKTWEAEIAWRLGRDYELRWLPERERPDYLAQIDRLLPFDDEEAVREGVLRVGRLALPSVLESLMIGVGGRASMGDREVITARSDGLGSLGATRRDIYAERSQRLTFQHRMHPEISTMPRRLFYNNEALHDAKGLGARPWGCDCFGDYRAVWVPVDGSLSGNANEREAREVVRQLERFLRWADANPHHNGAAWEVAVLTFYLGQESALRALLDASDLARTGYGSYAQAGRSGASTATVKLCTVDSFQGHEADIVFLSFVQTRKVGFLRSFNRLNVAVTRARHQLVLVGAQRFFWRALGATLRCWAARVAPCERGGAVKLNLAPRSAARALARHRHVLGFGQRRPEIVAILVLAGEQPHAVVTGADVSRSLLAGRPHAVGERLLEVCSMMRLVERTSTRREARLAVDSTSGAELIESGEVPSPERGEYDLWLLTDLLYPEAIVRVRHAEREPSDSERRPPATQAVPALLHERLAKVAHLPVRLDDDVKPTHAIPLAFEPLGRCLGRETCELIVEFAADGGTAKFRVTVNGKQASFAASAQLPSLDDALVASLQELRRPVSVTFRALTASAGLHGGRSPLTRWSSPVSAASLGVV